MEGFQQKVTMVPRTIRLAPNVEILYSTLPDASKMTMNPQKGAKKGGKTAWLS